MSTPPSPADRTLDRLRRMAEGNGLTAKAIELIDKTESIYTLYARLQMTPHMDVTVQHYPGGTRKKPNESFSSFSTLRNAVTTRQQSFSSSQKWIEDAKKQILDRPGNGWGLDGAKITLPSQTTMLSATETCPACNGQRQNTCVQCQGNKQVLCTHCQGTGKENCPHCFGRGEDPVTPNQKCPVCVGARQTMCRYCHSIGWLPCPTCQGRGGILCTECQGAGKLTEEVTLTGCAQTQFGIIKGGAFPSGLLQALDRIGLAKITQGHADVSLDTPEREKDDPELPANMLFYKASIPFTDMRVRFNGGRVTLVSIFGKKAAVLGCPSFLDDALTPQREDLRHAAVGLAPIENALKARALREALDIVLARKGGNSVGHMKELRRLYPYGLSTDAIKEIIRDTQKALNFMTRRHRLTAAITAGSVGAALFAGLFFSSAQATFIRSFNPAFAIIMDVLALSAVAGSGWHAIRQTAQWALQNRFPKTQIPRQPKIGKIGNGFLIGTFIVWLLFLLFAPVRPF